MDLRGYLVIYLKRVFQKLNISLDNWLIDLNNYAEQKLIQKSVEFEIIP